MMIVSISGPDTRETDPTSDFLFCEDGLRDVIPIAHALFVGVARAHRIAAVVEDPPREQGRGPRAPYFPPHRAFSEFRLDGVEQFSLKYRRMLAFVDFATIGDVANVKAVFQNMRQRADHVTRGGDRRPAGEHARFRPDALPFQRGGQLADRPEPQIVLENLADQRGFLRNNFQLLADAAIAERDWAVRPSVAAARAASLLVQNRRKAQIAFSPSYSRRTRPEIGLALSSAA